MNAAEALKISEEKFKQSQEVILNKVFEQIRNATKYGSTHIYVESISSVHMDYLVTTLEELGYKVTRSLSTLYISWHK